MGHRTVSAALGASALVGLLVVGGLAMVRQSGTRTVGGADDAGTTSTSDGTTSVAASTSVPGVVVRCGEVYNENDVLPLGPCDKGYGVEILQESLTWLGAAIDIDGYYGQATTDAVVEFQVRNGLPPTGVTDAATWLAIVGEPPGYDLDGDGVIGPNEIVFD